MDLDPKLTQILTTLGGQRDYVFKVMSQRLRSCSDDPRHLIIY